jgi:GrpB-like predicted nucleotidyltransferase (UPF0157 family)
LAILANMSRPVSVVAYDERWPELFAREVARLRIVAGSLLSEIDHFGSTAVPGLAAKPTIDIQATVEDGEAFSSLRPLLEGDGWILARHRLDERRWMFHRAKGEERTHHLHCLVRGHPAIVRQLLFRDYLRVHPDVAEAYETLKFQLAAQHPRDIDGYIDKKDAFMREHLARAETWRGGN